MSWWVSFCSCIVSFLLSFLFLYRFYKTQKKEENGGKGKKRGNIAVGGDWVLWWVSFVLVSILFSFIYRILILIIIIIIIIIRIVRS